jgi:hypothetical protein
MNGRQILRIPLVFAALVAVACTPAALASSSASSRFQPGTATQQAADQVTVPLTDPSRPALIDVSLVAGSITVRGTNRRDVSVTARSEAERPRRRYDANAEGLRRIPQSAGFRISEEANRVKVNSDNHNRSLSFEIEVPLRSNLKLSTVNDGEILVENVDGDHEISNTNGGIALNNLAGAVTARTTNGNVKATLTRITEQRAMAFTSLNGTVDVTLPPATKANLRMRSNNGDVYSDFDMQLASSTPSVEESRSSNGRYRINRNRAIVGTINGGGPEFELRTFNSNVYVRKGR